MPKKKDEYIQNGSTSSFIDLEVLENNTLRIQGHPEHINSHFLSPPLVIPEYIESKQHFWDVGDKIWDASVKLYRDGAGNKLTPAHEAIEPIVTGNKQARETEEKVQKFIEALNRGSVMDLGEGSFFLPSLGEILEAKEDGNTIFFQKLITHPQCPEDFKEKIRPFLPNKKMMYLFARRNKVIV